MLSPCPACQHAVSAQASACPGCGQPLPLRRVPVSLVLAIVGGFSLVMFITMASLAFMTH